MKAPHFFITLAIGILCVVLTIVSIVLGKTNNAMLQTQQQQQEEINRGNMSVQITQNILRDMAEASVRNPAMKDQLEKMGLKVNVVPPGGAAPATNATPALETPSTTPAK